LCSLQSETALDEQLGIGKCVGTGPASGALGSLIGGVACSSSAWAGASYVLSCSDATGPQLPC
jgi:hypothetical protein